MASVGVNPPKTPVTEGSSDVAPATLPNVCKMPGPPAPFVPTPLPNIGRSADRLQDATSTVRIEDKKVAIKGSYYMSQPSGDVASQGTGGGIVSSQVQGKTEFVAPGSMNVKAEGKNIQLLGDAMTNNGGSPANSGTMPGNQQPPAPPPPTAEELLQCIACHCDQHINTTQPALSCRQSGTAKHDCCESEIQSHRATGNPPSVDGEHGYNMGPPLTGIVGSRTQNFLARTLPRGSLWPDAAALDANGNVQQFFDFKFKCSTAKYAGPPTWRRLRGGVSQQQAYDDLSQALNPGSSTPEIIHNDGTCPPSHACP